MDYFRINNLQFNQDHGCFSCSMDSGARIYNMEPLRELTHLDSSTVGSLTLCEMLYRTNILGMVGGGNKQRLAENTVLLWDDLGRKFISEFTFSSPVLSMRIRRDRIYVAEALQIHVFAFPDFTNKLSTFDTGKNPKGLCEVSPFPSSERQLLIFPGHYRGSIQIVDLAAKNPGQTVAPIIINAHDTEIVYIAMNQQGTLVATASMRGTLIRVFDTFKKTRLIELRRGSDTATLYCINFSSNSDLLCASSDKGTVHIFSLKESVKNRKSMLSNAAKFIGPIGAYAATSQWSFAAFTVTQECKCICAFGSNSSIYAICVDGTFHKYVYTETGSCNRKSYDVFLDLYDEEEF
ncbi:WD repeat domain phosphoinositide-interacting protein 4 [Parasteatoda tepidariorum]|uniref:WD repeat domain phosphoinositide-interacting protein 4 n=1 Tax=Parasteatoda tepidariorum TaxID=114398 RepID=UPI00077F9A3B|nr:WD repeat domain phosphoinositide-interacting protein 4 [Parasteatoda tepidariorum]